MFFVQITFQMYDLFPYYYYSQFLCTFVDTNTSTKMGMA